MPEVQSLHRKIVDERDDGGELAEADRGLYNQHWNGGKERKSGEE
jgi:hypothetical protein